MKRGRKSAHDDSGLAEAKDRCAWTGVEEAALIDYVFANRAKGGDGMNFDATFWTAAVTEMASHFSGKGKAPDVPACKSKWGRVRIILSVPSVGPPLMIPSAAVHVRCSGRCGQRFWHVLQC
jgi:hypothetical protein